MKGIQSSNMSWPTKGGSTVTNSYTQNEAVGKNTGVGKNGICKVAFCPVKYLKLVRSNPRAYKKGRDPNSCVVV